MDVGKFLDIIGQSPLWVKWCIALWFLAGTLLGITLFVFRPMESHSTAGEPISSQRDSSTSTVSSTPVTVNVSASVSAAIEQPFPEQLSLESYYKRLDALEGRFLQRHEFITSMKGKTVTWDGFVHEVSEHSSGVVVALKRRMADKSADVVAFFPLDFRVRAYSLQNKDHVRVKGTFSSDSSFPTINAAELLVLP